jgi:hypothetical protein
MERCPSIHEMETNLPALTVSVLLASFPSIPSVISYTANQASIPQASTEFQSTSDAAHSILSSLPSIHRLHYLLLLRF